MLGRGISAPLARDPPLETKTVPNLPRPEVDDDAGALGLEELADRLLELLAGGHVLHLGVHRPADARLGGQQELVHNGASSTSSKAHSGRGVGETEVARFHQAGVAAQVEDRDQNVAVLGGARQPPVGRPIAGTVFVIQRTESGLVANTTAYGPRVACQICCW